jgi:hypothetical protein
LLLVIPQFRLKGTFCLGRSRLPNDKRSVSRLKVYGVTAADVYRSPTCELLLNLQLSGERSLFVIYPAEKKVGMPNEGHFFLPPGYAFSRYVPPLVVFMDDPVQGGWDLQLQVTANSIEFSSAGRIRIVTE